MSAINYVTILDAVKTYGAGKLTSYRWFRDRYDASVGNLAESVVVVVCFGGIAPTERNTGGRSRVLTALLGIGVRGKDWATQEANLLGAIANLEYELQPPQLKTPFFALDPALVGDVSLEIQQDSPTTAVGRLMLSLYNEG